MHISIFILALLNSLLHSTKAQFHTDFCSINCADGQRSFIHTVCKRNYQCGPESSCDPIPSDQVFRDYMVRSHNELRNFIANGSNIQNYDHYRNPGAKNMHAVSYDLELEYVAQCWINTCVTEQNDDCRDVNRFSVGQNIYWARRPDIKEVIAQDSLSFWFDEIRCLKDIDWIDSYPGEAEFPNGNKMKGFFTQLVWAETKYIGCARAISKIDKTQATLICNYGPGGNMFELPVYHLAEDNNDIASECNVRHSEFKALCGKALPSPRPSCKGSSSLSPRGVDTAEELTPQEDLPPLPPPWDEPSIPVDVPMIASVTRRLLEPDCTKRSGLTDDEKEFCFWLKNRDNEHHSGSCFPHNFMMPLFILNFIQLYFKCRF